uniref:AAA_12 domain-containing protein n=1 Tax=Caenorhabditis japonica TaxID=281687 RepID=A0A8R1IF67_CAEJA
MVLIDTSFDVDPNISPKTWERAVYQDANSENNSLNNTHSNKSFANLREGEIIVEYYMNLRSRGMELSEIAIITPYRAQMDCIADLFREKIRESKEEDDFNLEDINLGTVDSYQGQEFSVVLFSMVRSNPKFNLGFVSDLRRLNVAITRAKYQFMLVGNGVMLYKSHNEFIRKLFYYFQSNKRRFPPSIVFNEIVPFDNDMVKNNFGARFTEFIARCNDPEMIQHCHEFNRRGDTMEHRQKIRDRHRAERFGNSRSIIAPN